MTPRMINLVNFNPRAWLAAEKQAVKPVAESAVTFLTQEESQISEFLDSQSPSFLGRLQTKLTPLRVVGGATSMAIMAALGGIEGWQAGHTLAQMMLHTAPFVFGGATLGAAAFIAEPLLAAWAEHRHEAAQKQAFNLIQKTNKLLQRDERQLQADNKELHLASRKLNGVKKGIQSLNRGIGELNERVKKLENEANQSTSRLKQPPISDPYVIVAFANPLDSYRKSA